MPKKEIYIKTYKQTKEFGNSAYFDGGTDVLTITSNAVFNLSASVTVECWVYPLAVANGMPFEKSVGGLANTSFLLFWTALGIYFRIKSGGTLYEAGYLTTIPTNQWFHLAGTYDGSNVKLYINGLLVATTARTGTIDTGNGDLRVGSHFNPNFTVNGYMQEVRLWTTARTQDQIQANRNKKLIGSESGLIWLSDLNNNVVDKVASRNATNTGVTFVTTTAPVYTRTFKGFTQEYAFNSINSNVNSGYGDVSFTIPRKFDDPATRDLVGLDGYELDVVAYDNQQNTGQILFSGEIVKEDISMSNTESVEVTAIAPIWRLEKTPLVSSGSYTVSYSSIELATIFRNIIDIYNSQNNFNQLSYTASSIATTGISRTLNFNNATCLDALKSVYKLTNTDWVWFIDVDRVVYLKQLASTPTHYFFVGKDVVSIKRTKDKTTIVNNLLFWNGEPADSIAKSYTNQASIDSYGLLTTKIKDNRYTNATSIDSLGARTTTVNANPNTEVEIQVLDSSGGGYDLETVKVGDTCKILNIGTDTGLSDNMVITSKQDKLNSCVLTISDKSTFVARELFDLRKNQEQSNYEGGPTTYSGTPEQNDLVKGWYPVEEDWSYATTSGIIHTINVPPTSSARFQKGDKIYFTQSSTIKYFYIVSIPSSTTIVITGGTDYTLTNNLITNIYLSRIENPFGFPGWFRYAATWGAVSPMTVSSVSDNNFAFSITNKMINIVGRAVVNLGGSGSYGVYATLPFNAINTIGLQANTVSGGYAQNTGGYNTIIDSSVASGNPAILWRKYDGGNHGIAATYYFCTISLFL